jgi:hypothetical protein
MFLNHCIHPGDPSGVFAGGVMGAETGHCAVEWQDKHDDFGLSTGPSRRPSQPTCRVIG